MDTYLLSNLIVLGTLILISMFFSAVETSLLSFPRPLLQRKAQEANLLGLAFKEWQEHPNRILTSILIGNNAVVIAATTLSTYMAIHMAEVNNWSKVATGSVASVAVTFAIIIFGEAIPKVMGRSFVIPMAQWLVIPIYLFDRLLTPFTWMMIFFVSRFFPKLGHSSVSQVTEEDIKHMIEMGQKEGTIQEEEKKMIHSIFKFTDTKAGEVMIPRTDMFCVDIKTDFDRLLDLVIQNGFSRVPVYRGDMDHIVGVIYTRDLLSIWKNKELIVIQDLLRKPYFVPESTRVDRLLREFKRGKVHMAIVVDEYGGTAGLVTLEDLVEEIVGEIRDEHDMGEEKPIIKIGDNSWVVEADLALDEVNEVLGLHLTPKGEVASLGGYIMELAGRVPKKGRVFEDREVVFKILDAIETAVTKVRVAKRKTPLPVPQPEAPAAPKPRKKKAKTLAAEVPLQEVSAVEIPAETPVAEASAETIDPNVEKPS